MQFYYWCRGWSFPRLRRLRSGQASRPPGRLYIFSLVPRVGLEPTLPKERDFKSLVYTNFTTAASSIIYYNFRRTISQATSSTAVFVNISYSPQNTVRLASRDCARILRGPPFFRGVKLPGNKLGTQAQLF